MKNKVISIVLSLIGLISFGVGCSDSSNVPKAESIRATNIPANTIGVFVVMDGSGSMAENVVNAQGHAEQKYIIANRALIALGKRLDTYLCSPDRHIFTGIVLLHDSKYFISAEALLDKGAENFFKGWVSKYPGPNGGTPLGWAIEKASDEMLNLNLKAKHIIVITDGENNIGKPPEAVMPKILDCFVKKGSPLGIHFLAFDVSASIFNEPKKLGATVLGASNESELNEKLNVVLKDKILLEREF